MVLLFCSIHVLANDDIADTRRFFSASRAAVDATTTTRHKKTNVKPKGSALRPRYLGGKGKGGNKGSDGDYDDDDEPEDCIGTLQEFTRSVLVNFVGNPELLDAIQLQALEDAFLLTYNELLLTQCPNGSIREVVQVEPVRQKRHNVTVVNCEGPLSI